MITNPLDPCWLVLVRIVEAMGHGELKIIVVNGKPVRIENVVQSIKLDDPASEPCEGLIQL